MVPTHIFLCLTGLTHKLMARYSFFQLRLCKNFLDVDVLLCLRTLALNRVRYLQQPAGLRLCRLTPWPVHGTLTVYEEIWHTMRRASVELEDINRHAILKKCHNMLQITGGEDCQLVSPRLPLGSIENS